MGTWPFIESLFLPDSFRHIICQLARMFFDWRPLTLAHARQFPSKSPPFFITGFLASLTTFSTFTAEWFTLFTEKQFGWMLLLICAHLVGGFIFIFLGMTTTEGIFFTHE